MQAFQALIHNKSGNKNFIAVLFVTTHMDFANENAFDSSQIV